MLNRVSKFTCAHQHVLVKHCLLCNFPAAPPSLLLLPHCEMSQEDIVENSNMEIIYLNNIESSAQICVCV